MEVAAGFQAANASAEAGTPLPDGQAGIHVELPMLGAVVLDDEAADSILGILDIPMADDFRVVVRLKFLLKFLYMQIL